MSSLVTRLIYYIWKFKLGYENDLVVSVCYLTNKNHFGFQQYRPLLLLFY